MTDQESKNREKILRAAKKFRGNAPFGKTEDNEPYFCGLKQVPADTFPAPASEEDKLKSLHASWEPRLYTEENVRYIVQGGTGGKTRIFVLYKDNTLRRFSYKLGDRHALLEETIASEIPEMGLEDQFPHANEPRFKYMNWVMEQQKKKKAVQSRYVPLDYLPEMK